MSDQNEKVVCETPTPGKQPTRIDRWKYNAIRDAILAIVRASGDGVPFKGLSGEVAQRIDAATKDKIGSISWYTTVVKLDLECKGEISRVDGAKPQRLVKTG